MNPTEQQAPNEKTDLGKERAAAAVTKGIVSPLSESMLRNLFDVLNYPMHTVSLRYRLAAAMMICNTKGIMAGRQGGNEKGAEMPPTKYRKSATPSAAPTENLPTSLSALRADATMTDAPPEYGDSQVAMVSRSAQYNPTPIFADFAEYAEYEGPPLAPRGILSRTITNYGVSDDGSDQDVRLECGWDGVFGYDDNGNETAFLEKHFEGDGETKRDLRGYTDYEVAQAMRQVLAWMNKLATGRDYD